MVFILSFFVETLHLKLLTSCYEDDNRHHFPSSILRDKFDVVYNHHIKPCMHVDGEQKPKIFHCVSRIRCFCYWCNGVSSLTTVWVFAFPFLLFSYEKSFFFYFWYTLFFRSFYSFSGWLRQWWHQHHHHHHHGFVQFSVNFVSPSRDFLCCPSSKWGYTIFICRIIAFTNFSSGVFASDPVFGGAQISNILNLFDVDSRGGVEMRCDVRDRSERATEMDREREKASKIPSENHNMREGRKFIVLKKHTATHNYK